MRPGSFAAAAAGWVALALGCGAPADLPRANVLLVVADTLRADKLGCYGNEAGLSPRIDALAETGVVFEHASAHAPWTLPSVASLLTSLLPEQHGAGGSLGGFTARDPSATSVASAFRDAGYATAAFVNVGFLGPAFGLMEGFDEVDASHSGDNLHVRRADANTRAVLRWLDEEVTPPFFALVHYFDAHAVYDPPQPFRRRFAAPVDRRSDFAYGTREHMARLRRGDQKVRPPIVRRAERLYEGEVAYLDSEIGNLVTGLSERGLADSTLLVLTADHGEEFLDHGGFEHGHSLYAELLHVPLIFRHPALRARRVSQGVGLVDVAPTLCELTRVPCPASFRGRSLLPLLRGGRGPDRPVRAHGNMWDRPLTSLREGEWKLIRVPDEAGERVELYRWRDDPGEREDLAERHPEVVASLLERLAGGPREGPAAARDGDPASAVELDAGLRAELEALGYVLPP